MFPGCLGREPPMRDNLDSRLTVRSDLRPETSLELVMSFLRTQVDLVHHIAMVARTDRNQRGRNRGTASVSKRLSFVAAVLIASALVSIGCSSEPGGLGIVAIDSTFRDDNPFAQPDLVQPRIAPGALVQGVWIPGTHRAAGLVQSPNGSCSLDLIDTDSPSMTPLVQDGACDGLGYRWLSISSDGTSLYYLHENGMIDTSSRTIRRLNLANLQVTDVVTIPGGAESFSLSPDGKKIVYTGYYADSIGFRLRDIATGWDTLVVRSSHGAYLFNGARFSPDGSEIVFEDSAGIHLHRLDISTGANAVVPGGIAGNPFEWTSIGIQLRAVVSPCRPNCEELTNEMTGQQLGLYEDNEALAWSPDGQHVAGGTPWCNNSGCSLSRTEIAVANWPTHRATIIARESGAGLPVLVVSPDGRTVVYGVSSGTYVWNHP